MARLQPSPATAKWLTPWRATACNAALHGRQSLPMLPGQLVAMLRTWVRWLHSLLTMECSALLQPAWEGTKPEPIDWDALIQEVR